MKLPSWLNPILEKLAPIHRAIRSFAVEIVLKRLLVPIVLFLTYFLGVGLTALFARILFRAKMHAAAIHKDTFWIKAEGYEPNEAHAREQS